MSAFTRETTGIEVVTKFSDLVENKTILITGTSDGGLGAETAISLAHANPAQIILLARSESKVAPVISKIHALNPSIKATFFSIELDDFDSVRRCAANINAQITKLDIMINNAGIMAVVNFTTNKIGIESQFATNHLGHFLLTALLFPKISAVGSGARIINLTSDGYTIGPCRFEDYNFKDGKEYDPWSGYGQAKTSNILFTRQLASKLASKGILSFAVHPGVIMGTNLSNHLDRSVFKDISAITERNTGFPFEMGQPKEKQQGVATTLVTALDPSITGVSGSYWEDAKTREMREYASSMENAERLWTLSEKLVGERWEL